MSPLRRPGALAARSQTSATHWDAVYGARNPKEVSWFQPDPATSLRLLMSTSVSSGAVIDVGAGASTLADTLLDTGWSDVSVLDVSSEALSVVRRRLGDRGQSLSLVPADLLSWQPERYYDAWHDRAVFHFFVQPDQRGKYAATASRAVRPGGVLILGTFAADGPTQCSGLPTARYDAEALAAVFAADFRLEHCEREEHLTPAGVVQPFTWAVLRRR